MDPRYTQQTTIEVDPIVTYAGFWKRFFAFIIDSIILSLVSVILHILFGIGVDKGGNPFINFIIFLLYYGAMESSPYQATLGKMVLGIIVTDTHVRRVSFLRAVSRNLAKILSTLILGIGYLMIAFTARKQGLHDMIAECLVINKPKDFQS